MKLFEDFEPKAYIFDFDGTLAASMEAWITLGRTFLKELGRDQDDAFFDALYVMGLEEFARFIIEHYDLDETPEQMTQELIDRASDFHRNTLEFKPGAVEFIRQLSERALPVALATSNNKALVDLALGRHGLNSCFTTLCFCEDVHANKEHPDIYLEAARRVGVPIVDCAIFEDLMEPLRTAKKTGAHIVAVLDEHSDQDLEELEKLADRVITDYVGLEP